MENNKNKLQVLDIQIELEKAPLWIRERGVIVDVHVGRKRSYIEVTPKTFGINIASESMHEFFESHVEMGRIKFIPDYLEKKLNNVESRIRMNKKRRCIGYKDSFMTLKDFEAFKVEFLEAKEDYMKVLDDITSSWDLIKLDFKTKLENTLDSLEVVDRNEIANSILKRIPSLDEYEASFHMGISVNAFPLPQNVDFFPEEIQESVKEGIESESKRMLVSVMESIFVDCFTTVGRLFTLSDDVDRIPSKTIGAINSIIKRISDKNIFESNIISSIEDEIREILKATDDFDTALELAEILLAKVYYYAEKIGVDDKIKISNLPFDREELLSMGEMLVTEDIDH